MIYTQIHRHTPTRFHIERTHMIRTTTDNRRTRLRRQCNQHEMTNGSGTNVKMRQHKKRYTHTNTKRNSRAARVECFWLQIQRRRHRFDLCLCENDDDGVEDEVYGDEKSNESMNWVEHFSHFFSCFFKRIGFRSSIKCSKSKILCHVDAMNTHKINWRCQCD